MKLIFEKLNCYFYSKWHLAVLDMGAGIWVIEPKALNIPYLKAQNVKGRHILLKPEPTIESYYLLVDDLTWPMILSHHHYTNGGWKPGRMVVETSPANYQVWIHSSRRLSLSEKQIRITGGDGVPDLEIEKTNTVIPQEAILYQN